MESLGSKLDFETYKNRKPVVAFRSRRDELVDGFVQEINKLRTGTKYKPVTHKQIAIRINKNPFFRDRDGEVELLLKTCREKNNFSKFFWVCPLHEKKIES